MRAMTYLGLATVFAALPVAACGMIATGLARNLASFASLTLTAIGLALL